MIKHILESVIAARENFEAEPNITNGMSWGYNASRLSMHLKANAVEPEELEVGNAEMIKYIHSGY